MPTFQYKRIFKLAINSQVFSNSMFYNTIALVLFVLPASCALAHGSPCRGHGVLENHLVNRKQQCTVIPILCSETPALIALDSCPPESVPFCKKYLTEGTEHLDPLPSYIEAFDYDTIEHACICLIAKDSTSANHPGPLGPPHSSKESLPRHSTGKPEPPQPSGKSFLPHTSHKSSASCSYTFSVTTTKPTNAHWHRLFRLWNQHHNLSMHDLESR